MFEMKVIVKGEEAKYTHDFCVYEDCKLSCDDEIIKEHVKQALDMSKIVPERIQIKINMEFVGG